MEAADVLCRSFWELHAGVPKLLFLLATCRPYYDVLILTYLEAHLLALKRRCHVCYVLTGLLIQSDLLYFLLTQHCRKFNC